MEFAFWCWFLELIVAHVFNPKISCFIRQVVYCRFSTRYKAFLSEILGFSKLCCTRQRFLNRCKPLSFTVDLFLLLMACLVQHSFEKPRVSDKNADHLSTFLGFGTPEPGPVMNKFRSNKPILSSQNSFQNHGSGHVQNCQTASE